jgi:hypothetical protein
MVMLERQPGPTYASATGLVPLDAVAGVERHFPAEWISPSGHDIEPVYGAYAGPLVGRVDRSATLT